MRVPVVIFLASVMIILAACSSDASDARATPTLISAGIAITEFHDDQGLYSPLLSVSGCFAVFPVQRFGFVLNVSRGRRSYTMANSDLLAAHRKLEAQYVDLMPAVQCNLGSRNLAYLGVGTTLVIAAVHRKVDVPGHPTLWTKRDLGNQWGFCIGVGMATRLIGPVSIVVSARDRFVVGEYSMAYTLIDDGTYSYVEDIPLGGFEVSVGLGLL
jgi:hypothetical protein